MAKIPEPKEPEPVNTLPLRARGLSMFPTIREGDLLTIFPKPFAEVIPGDIAVFRHRGVLVAHRVHERVGDAEQGFLRTRSDHAAVDDSFECRPDVFQGIVSGIERDGKSIPTACTDFTVRSSIEWLLRNAWQRVCSTIRPWAEALMAHTQTSRFFQKSARLLWKAKMLRAEYELDLVLNPEAPHRFVQRYSAQDLHAIDWVESGATFKGARLKLAVNGHAAASCSFALPLAEDRQTPMKTTVRRRFQHLGLETRLFRKLSEIGVSCYPDHDLRRTGSSDHETR